MSITRRSFLAGSLTTFPAIAAISREVSQTPRFVLFTDNLADLSLQEACRAARGAGFDGVDLTVRPGGHVLPENADKGLLEARRIADGEGVSIPMISTAVNDTDSPFAATIFDRAAEIGVERIKLGYWRYEPFGTAADQFQEARRKLERIVTGIVKSGPVPCVHVHSGNNLANGGAMVYLLLKDFQPTEAGAYVDPMHMSVEGGLSGWEIGLDLVAPWLALVGLKNYRWKETKGGEGQMARYSTEYVPLAEGMAPVDRFAARLQELGYTGIYSFHSEYKGGSSFRSLTTPELL